MELVVAVIGIEVRVLHSWVQVELMSGKWINGNEGQLLGLGVLEVAHVLDGLLKNLVLPRRWCQWSRHVTHAPNDDVHVDVLKLLSNAV